MGKRQRHKAFGLRLRKVAPHTVHATVRAACLTEQRKADGIKERCFPCACVAADEKKPLLSKLFKGNLRLLRKGANGGNRQF